MESPPLANAKLTELIMMGLAAIAPEADLSHLDPARAFRDQIELDSVDFLNFVLTLEKRLERPIPAVHYPRLSSLQGCLEYLGVAEPRPTQG
ncbi:MAG TPA: acyl carrier protein [Chromatiaceae bacterium]|jgi:acyl carrier protein|nr:acyl carrier protein [Chromatiaceae bacterium]